LSILVYAFLIGVIAGALAKMAGKDLPIALLEDAVAILGALFIVSRV